MSVSESLTHGVHEILRTAGVRTVFQPIVELHSTAIVGYEALTRGPEGPLERPDLLFDAARAADRLADLDELCRRTALETAIGAHIVAPTAVFINVEPEALVNGCLDDLIALAAGGHEEMQIVLEITERSMSARPAELLAAARRIREAGWRLALDDVGADDMSLAFMPLLQPDVVKLDLRLVQSRPGPAVAEIMNAVNAYAERSGAAILAEGIEDDGQLQIARALGATLGQGWLFGRPARIDRLANPAHSVALPRARVTPTVSASPFECVPSDQPLRVSTKALLIEVSKYLEREAVRLGSACMVLSAFQHARHFTVDTARRYRELAAHVGFAVALGEDLSAEPVRGIRGAHLAEGDAVRGEWDVVVMAPHFAAALLARDLGDDGPERDRRFEFVVTYDRDVVSAAAQSLTMRVLTEVSSATPHPRTAAVDPPVVSEQTLRRALSATTNGVTIADVMRPDHPLVYVNSAFERLTGTRAEDLLGRNCRQMQGPDTDRSAVARIAAAISDGREIRETLRNYRGPENEPWWNEVYLAPVFDERGGLTHYIGVQNDVTARVEAQQQLSAERERSAAYLKQLETLAFHDPLTGVVNRRKMYTELEDKIAESRRRGTAVAVLYVDVDDFKQINDELGHVAGDTVLQTVADRLQGAAADDGLVARLGGDEFLIVSCAPDRVAARATADRLAASVLDALTVPVVLRSVSLTVRVSVGTGVFPDDGASFDELVHAADQRMYRMKNATEAPLAG